MRLLAVGTDLLRQDILIKTKAGKGKVATCMGEPFDG